MHLSNLAYLCGAGSGHCGCITPGCCYISDLLTELQDHAYSLVCCVAVGTVSDAYAVGIPACLGCRRGVGHHEWQCRSECLVTVI